VVRTCPMVNAREVLTLRALVACLCVCISADQQTSRLSCDAALLPARFMGATATNTLSHA
jgi:hypothetical protein